MTLRWFNIALVGWVLLIVALAVGAYMLGAPPVWIGIGALALIGIAVIMSANRSSTPSSGGGTDRRY